jgi:hypothetical protein
VSGRVNNVIEELPRYCCCVFLAGKVAESNRSGDQVVVGAAWGGAYCSAGGGVAFFEETMCGK